MAAGHYRYECQPAASIIRRIGGVRKVAAALGVSPEAVSKCNRPKSHGGTDGRFPAAWWRRLLDMAEARGMPRYQVYAALRLAAKPPKTGENPVHASKRKGDRFERQVVDDLNAAGVKAKRVPLSGAAPGWTGDVLAQGKDGEWKIQCKITASLAGRGAVIEFLRNVNFGVVVAGDVSYVAMRRGVFIDMLKGVTPTAINVPRLEIARAKLVASAIDGHDALVFRRDQATEWLVLVREDK